MPLEAMTDAYKELELRSELVVVLRRGPGLLLVLEPDGRKADTAPVFCPLRRLIN